MTPLEQAEEDKARAAWPDVRGDGVLPVFHCTPGTLAGVLLWIIGILAVIYGITE